ncbi:hypothetical protein [Shinella sp. BYT-45]
MAEGKETDFLHDVCLDAVRPLQGNVARNMGNRAGLEKAACKNAAFTDCA